MQQQFVIIIAIFTLLGCSKNKDTKKKKKAITVSKSMAPEKNTIRNIDKKVKKIKSKKIVKKPPFFPQKAIKTLAIHHFTPTVASDDLLKKLSRKIAPNRGHIDYTELLKDFMPDEDLKILPGKSTFLKWRVVHKDKSKKRYAISFSTWEEFNKDNFNPMVHVIFPISDTNKKIELRYATLSESDYFKSPLIQRSKNPIKTSEPNRFSLGRVTATSYLWSNQRTKEGAALAHLLVSLKPRRYTTIAKVLKPYMKDEAQTDEFLDLPDEKTYVLAMFPIVDDPISSSHWNNNLKAVVIMTMDVDFRKNPKTSEGSTNLYAVIPTFHDEISYEPTDDSYFKGLKVVLLGSEKYYKRINIKPFVDKKTNIKGLKIRGLAYVDDLSSSKKERARLNSYLIRPNKKIFFTMPVRTYEKKKEKIEEEKCTVTTKRRIIWKRTKSGILIITQQYRLSRCKDKEMGKVDDCTLSVLNTDTIFKDKMTTVKEKEIPAIIKSNPELAPLFKEKEGKSLSECKKIGF